MTEIVFIYIKKIFLTTHCIGRNLISFQSLGLDIQVPPDMKTYYVGQMSIDV